MTSVYAHKDGKWVPSPDPAVPDLVFARYQGTWRPVKSAHVYRRNALTGKFEWQTIFKRVQYPPKDVRGTAVNGQTGGTLSWSPPADASANVPLEYQVRSYLAGAGATMYPWTRSLSQAFTGLKASQTYEFEVAVRPVTGVQIEAISTPRIKLATGHPAVPRVGSRTVAIQPLRTDTWSPANKWSEGSGGVRQGYASDRQRNGHGAVYYNSSADSVYANVLANLKAAKIPEPDQTVINAKVASARITLVHRMETTHAAKTMGIYVYASKLNFNSTAAPVAASGMASFAAPEENENKENFAIGGDAEAASLTRWAQNWLDRTDAHNGLLIRRTDGGNADVGYFGFCVFRGATYSADWQLKLNLTWNFNYPLAANAKWL
jgi:hypothetical protein